MTNDTIGGNNNRLIPEHVLCNEYFQVSQRTFRRWRAKREELLALGKSDEALKMLPMPKRMAGSRQRHFLLADVIEFLAENTKG